MTSATTGATTDDLARGRAALETGQQILQEQNLRFAATYEHATVGIAEVDAQGRRMRVNEAACAITGRSRAELTGGSVFNVLHSEDRDSDYNQYQRLVAGEIDRYSIEKRIVRKDGNVIWVAVMCSSVRDAAGKFDYGVRIFEDITERKLAEEKLRERERQFRELLEGLPAAVYATDTLGRVTFYNQAVVELSGYRPELGSDEWPVAWPLYRPDGTPLPYDQSPMAAALQRKPTRAGCRGGGRATRWHARPIHTVSDAAARCLGHPHRRSQRIGGCQRAQTGRNRSKGIARRAESSRQEQHADVAFPAQSGAAGNRQRGGASRACGREPTHCRHGRGAAGAL